MIATVSRSSFIVRHLQFGAIVATYLLAHVAISSEVMATSGGDSLGDVLGTSAATDIRTIEWSQLPRRSRRVLSTGHRNILPNAPLTAGQAAGACGNAVFTPFGDSNAPFQWVQPHCLEGEDIRVPFGASGIAFVPDPNYPEPPYSARDHISTVDLPFTHPFGLDWVLFMSPDEGFRNLLAPGNFGRAGDAEIDAAIHYAAERLPSPTPANPLLVLEVDQGLIPARYRPADQDEVVAFGRWIVDCGHSDYHTEIHPPMFLTYSPRPPARFDRDPNWARANFVGLPLLSSQKLTNTRDGQGRPRLGQEAWVTQGSPAGRHLMDEMMKIITLRSLGMEAYPQFVDAFPFETIYSFILRPARPRRPGEALALNYQIRQSPGTRLMLSAVGDSSVEVRVVVNPWCEPGIHGYTTVHEKEYTIEDLLAMAGSKYGWVPGLLDYARADAITGGALTFAMSGGFVPPGLVPPFLQFFWASILDEGVKTIAYTPLAYTLSGNADRCWAERSEYELLLRAKKRLENIPARKVEARGVVNVLKDIIAFNRAYGARMRELSRVLQAQRCENADRMVTLRIGDLPKEFREIDGSVGNRREGIPPFTAIGWIEVGWGVGRRGSRELD